MSKIAIRDDDAFDPATISARNVNAAFKPWTKRRFVSLRMHAFAYKQSVWVHKKSQKTPVKSFAIFVNLIIALSFLADQQY